MNKTPFASGVFVALAFIVTAGPAMAAPTYCIKARQESNKATVIVAHGFKERSIRDYIAEELRNAIRNAQANIDPGIDGDVTILPIKVGIPEDIDCIDGPK